MAVIWLLALAVSFWLRFWGYQHPDPFIIRSSVVLLVLIVPVFILGIWVVWAGFLSLSFSENTSALNDQEKSNTEEVNKT